jgi:hypothetical protein
MIEDFKIKRRIKKMAVKTPEIRYIEAIESLQNVVRNEIALIDLDVRLIEDLSEEDREKTAEDDKNLFFRFLRRQIEEVISDIASLRKDEWKRVELARAEQLEEHAKKIRADKEAPSAAGRRPCPPGFIDVDGICVPI